MLDLLSCKKDRLVELDIGSEYVRVMKWEKFWSLTRCSNHKVLEIHGGETHMHGSNVMPFKIPTAVAHSFIACPVLHDHPGILER